MNLKCLILLGMLVWGSAALRAQTTGSNTTNGTTHSSESSYTAKGAKKTKKGKEARLNHRRIYHWKNGQRATPTGQEATGTGSGYSSIKKDTAGKREE